MLVEMLALLGLKGVASVGRAVDDAKTKRNTTALDSNGNVTCIGRTGKYYVNGYVMEYDRNRKSNIPVPTTVTIPVASKDAEEKEKKKVEAIKHKFIVEDDTYKEYGVVVDMLNGAQKTEITEDMLSDEEKEDLECGLITMDDIRKELGGNVYGERVKEYQFVKPAKGFIRGRQDTVYTDDDMVIKPLEEELPEGTEDLFDDDDEL